MTTDTLCNALQTQLAWPDAFTSHLQTCGRSQLTIAAYLQDMRSYSAWFTAHCGETFSPELLNSFDLRSFREYELEAMRRSPATWNRRLATLTVFCRWARSEGYLPEGYDPLFGVLKVDMADDDLAPRSLDKKDFGRLTRCLDRMLVAANTQQRKRRALRDRAMIALMLFAGLRDGELCRLATADFDLSERNGEVQVRRGKGDKYRSVPLIPDARRMVLEWLQVRGTDPGLLFEGITRRAVEKRIERIRDEAGIEALYPHQLRHTCATRMLDSGTSLRVVQAVLGHARLDTTGRYTRPRKDDLRRGLNSILCGGIG